MTADFNEKLQREMLKFFGLVATESDGHCSGDPQRCMHCISNQMIQTAQEAE